MIEEIDSTLLKKRLHPETTHFEQNLSPIDLAIVSKHITEIVNPEKEEKGSVSENNLFKKAIFFQ